MKARIRPDLSMPCLAQRRCTCEWNIYFDDIVRRDPHCIFHRLKERRDAR